MIGYEHPPSAPAPGRRRTLVLASSSPYRRALLERLRLPFHAVAPDIDERPRAGETPPALVQRLARAKATALAPAWPDALVIGSDQVAVNAGRILGKPGDHASACAQLRAASGREVSFPTGLCVLDTATGRSRTEVVTTTVLFRPLDDATIGAYLAAEEPYDCAGSFKVEGLGIALFERVTSDDPSALTGLPLIGLTTLLAAFDYAVLAALPGRR
ncbi:MAG: Maf family nucleotide pyrophosphatase [Gammaproteobacteria bacterium]